MAALHRSMNDPYQPPGSDSLSPSLTTGGRRGWLPFWIVIHLIITPGLVFLALIIFPDLVWLHSLFEIDQPPGEKGLTILLSAGAAHAALAGKHQERRIITVLTCITLQFVVFGILYFGTCCLILDGKLS